MRVALSQWVGWGVFSDSSRMRNDRANADADPAGDLRQSRGRLVAERQPGGGTPAQLLEDRVERHGLIDPAERMDGFPQTRRDREVLRLDDVVAARSGVSGRASPPGRTTLSLMKSSNRRRSFLSISRPAAEKKRSKAAMPMRCMMCSR